MNIDFANLKKLHQAYQAEIDDAMSAVVETCAFIMGPDVMALEEELCEFSGAKHAITCSSGTVALQLALMVMGIKPGDEVITTPFTFIATAEVIANIGAKPVFVDIDEITYTIDPNKIEREISPQTKAIIPVSLYGHPAEMNQINAIAQKHQLVVIEDAAQSFGAIYKEKKSCNLSRLGCTSFFQPNPSAVTVMAGLY